MGESRPQLVKYPELGKESMNILFDTKLVPTETKLQQHIHSPCLQLTLEGSGMD